MAALWASIRGSWADPDDHSTGGIVAGVIAAVVVLAVARRDLAAVLAAWLSFTAVNLSWTVIRTSDRQLSREDVIIAWVGPWGIVFGLGLLLLAIGGPIYLIYLLITGLI